jgi:hypothetical protein
MAKKLKVNLDGIKVRSFLTSLQVDEKDEVKGGSGGACCTSPKDYMCNTHYWECVESVDHDCDEPGDPE